MTEKNFDTVHRPAHYADRKIEVFDAIRGMELDWVEGTIVQYVARWRFKNGVEDLHKARWFLNRLIEEAGREATRR